MFLRDGANCVESAADDLAWAAGEIERLREIARASAEAATSHQCEVLSLRRVLFGLAANAGALRAFEPETRAAIGNTNWQAIADYVAQADALADALRPNVKVSG